MLSDTHVAVLEHKLQSVKLSEREASVALLWLQDHDYRSIAHRLWLSEHTVRTMIKSIHKKAEVHSKTALLLKILFD